MIPRFIIRKVTDRVLDNLKELGYELHPPLSEDVLVLGCNVLNSTTVPEVKNPLIKVFDFENLGVNMTRQMEVDVYFQAELQKKWNANTIKKELQLGSEKKGRILVTPLGVMIDSCIIPIETFRTLQKNFNQFQSPFIASHSVFINPKRPFFTVGCDDYSLDDLSTIISTYNTLLEPAS